MKDLRGANAAHVRSAISQFFRLQLLKSTTGKKNPKEVLAWKKSNEVHDSYVKLFDDDVLHKIALLAFPNSDTDDDSYYDCCNLRYNLKSRLSRCGMF